MLADKDAEGVARILDGIVERWYCASLNGARGQDGQALARRISSAMAGGVVLACGSVSLALAAARREAPRDACILVFGSFQTVAEAALALRRDGPAASRDTACC
jgi:dihydrofolate synthase/folylpolyglutamate synthase